MKVKDLLVELQDLDPELDVITIIDPLGARAAIECIDKGYFDGEKFISEVENSDNNPNAVDLVWVPF